MKFVKIFLVICWPLVYCNLLDVPEAALVTTQSPLFYVSGLIKDWNRKHPGMNQVVVLNVGRKSDLWEDVIKIIPKDNPVIIADSLKCRIIEKQKAEFIIITSDILDAKALMKSFRDCIDELCSHSTTNFIFLPLGPIKKDELFQIYQFFTKIHRLNVVILFAVEQKPGGLATKMFSVELFLEKILQTAPTTNTDLVFPDKLRNMNQYKYKLFGTEQSPRLFWKKGKFYGFDVFFMEIAAKKQNATFSTHYFNSKVRSDRKKFRSMMWHGKIDLSLNTVYKGGRKGLTKSLKNVNTFDVDGYCALIPIPPRPSFLTYLFVPYDIASWMCMLLSLVALAIIWYIFRAYRDNRNLSSVGRIVFRVIAGFLGQAFDFVVTRWFHLLVMQIFIFSVLILGNAYQSILISLLVSSRNGTRITTIHDMKVSGFNYISDDIFYARLKTHKPKSGVLKTLREDSQIYSTDVDYEALAANDTVLIMRCDVANDFFYTANNKFRYGHIADYYYILAEKFYSDYERLNTGRFSSFHERLSEISLRVFESGIRQHWKTLMHKLTDQIDLLQISIIKEEFLLKMGDFKYIFYIWAIGLSLATIAFLLELLCYKYRARLGRTWLVKMLRKLSWERIRRNREMLRARRRTRGVIEPFDIEQFEMIQC